MFCNSYIFINIRHQNTFVFFYVSSFRSNEDAIFLLWLPRVAADWKTSRSTQALLPSLIIPLYVLCFICFVVFVYLVASINKLELEHLEVTLVIR